MRSIVLAIFVFAVDALHGRSANDLLKDVFSHEDADPECSTTECQTAGYLLRSMNRSASPCDDFYEFACGQWVKTHRAKAAKTSWYQYKEAESTMTNHLREILEGENADAVLNPARTFYRSCLDSARNARTNMDYVKSIVRSFGGWPIANDDRDDGGPRPFDWTAMYVYMEKTWKVPTLMDAGLSVNHMDTSRYVLTIGQPELMLPGAMFARRDKYAVQMDAYARLIAGAVHLLHRPFGSPATARAGRRFGHEIAEEIIRFETRLAKMQDAGETKKSDRMSKNRVMTVDELQTVTNGVSDAFTVDWLQMFRRLFEGTGVIVEKSDKVFVKEENYLKDLVWLLENTPNRVLINYMSWCFLRSMLSDIGEDLKHLVEDFNVVFTGDVKDVSRWMDCVSTTSSYFAFNIGYKYVTKYFDESTKEMATEMVNNIQEAYAEQLENVVWMDPITRQSAVEKLQSMHKFIAYPDWFQNASYLQSKLKFINMTDNYLMNLEILQTSSNLKKLSKLKKVHDHTEWTMDIVSVNGYNDVYSNAIVLPAGMLQLPFYRKSRIQALNYGMVGLVVGHEIMHAFDDSGRMYDKRGNRRQWWTQETQRTFTERAECFVRQYDSYNLTVLGDSVKVNGRATQNENIADIGGLSHAFAAYRKYVDAHGAENRLPGLEELSPEQLFFVGFASIWCESPSEQTSLNDLLTDVHSPGRIRVLGTLSNSAEFADAFGCPAGSPMNPTDKCTIW